MLLFLKRKANARVSFYESSIEVRESQEYLDVSQIDFVQAQEVDCIRFENLFNSHRWNLHSLSRTVLTYSCTAPLTAIDGAAI